MKRIIVSVLMVVFFSTMVGGALAEDLLTKPMNVFEGWMPNEHWFLMDPEDAAAYEQAGWVKDTGFLWYNGLLPVQIDWETDINTLYQEGYRMHIIWHWIYDDNGYHESVYVGRWILSEDQAMKFGETYEVDTEYVISLLPGYEEAWLDFDWNEEYSSSWNVDGFSVTEPSKGEFTEPVEFFRLVFQKYESKGASVYLNTGIYDRYSESKALEIGAFEYEMPNYE